ncbi:MAG: hypothetical protein D3904_10145, partial [Candidatus Electrothrix sp. EH2]|nr:hypothetical protein [Candidatus Electrothrix sp. EH2]
MKKTLTSAAIIILLASGSAFAQSNAIDSVTNKVDADDITAVATGSSIATAGGIGISNSNN